MYGIVQSLLNDSIMDNNISVIDIINCKPFPKINKLIQNKDILIIDEQTSYGGLSAAVLEFLCDENINANVKRMTLPDKHLFENGGRSKILEIAGLGNSNITDKFKECCSFGYKNWNNILKNFPLIKIILKETILMPL